ncbi:MAG: TfpX/TfpZ family type IV pilin accessory protein [Pseudomonadota bacterium]
MMLERKTTILLHLALTAVVAAAVIAVIFVLWYPAPYFAVSGVRDVLLMLLGVHLVVGPLLTIYLYKPGKKGLWFDMVCVAVMQIAALGYGGLVIYEQRPLFVVFSVDRFTVLPGTDVVHDGSAIAACADTTRPPCLAVAVRPDDNELRNALLVRSLEEGIELEQQPEFWQPLSAQRASVLDKAQRLEALADNSDAAALGVSRVLTDTGRAADTLRWVPVVNKRLQSFALVIDAESAVPVDVVAVDPWGAGR